MGIYLNPGSMNFQMILNSEIYVDKTELIAYLNTLVNTNQRYVYATRPRRFGKTMAADMICAYYDRTADSREIFAHTLLAKQDSGYIPDMPWDNHLGRFNVNRIVMTDFIKAHEETGQGMKRMVNHILKELHALYLMEVIINRSEIGMMAISSMISRPLIQATRR